jgi:hypothetical protein
VALGNLLYVGLFRAGLKLGRWQGIGIAAAGKTAFLWMAFTWLLTLVSINPKIAAGLLFVMSWPQLVTTVLGGLLALAVVKRLNNAKK